MTKRNGISEEIAPAPSPYTFPKIQTALTATQSAESSAGGRENLISFPASIRTGAARKAFIPAYKTPPK
ncbi:MAG: hypothetical protein HDP28_02545 [Clostridia bacterium]|nr:hypothetical protein [Clostridia bacterium]